MHGGVTSHNQQKPCVPEKSTGTLTLY